MPAGPSVPELFLLADGSNKIPPLPLLPWVLGGSRARILFTFATVGAAAAAAVAANPTGNSVSSKSFFDRIFPFARIDAAVQFSRTFSLCVWSTRGKCHFLLNFDRSWTLFRWKIKLANKNFKLKFIFSSFCCAFGSYFLIGRADSQCCQPPDGERPRSRRRGVVVRRWQTLAVHPLVILMLSVQDGTVACGGSLRRYTFLLVLPFDSIGAIQIWLPLFIRATPPP